MPIGLLTGLGAAVTVGHDGCRRRDHRSTSREPRRRRRHAVRSASLVVLILVPDQRRRPARDAADSTFVLVLALGVVAMVAYLAYFTGLRIGPIAVVSPMVAAYGGLTVVLAVIVRGESLTAQQAFGAAVATVGIVMTGIALDGGSAASGRTARASRSRSSRWSCSRS